MADLITNGEFNTDLTGWSDAGDVEHDASDGASYKGCAKLIGQVDTPAELYQNVTVTEAAAYDFSFSLKLTDNGTGREPLIANVGNWQRAILTEELDQWEESTYQIPLLTGTVEIRFEGNVGLVYRLDDISLLSVAYEESYLGWIRQRLMSERDDPASIRHSRATYERVIAEACREAPRAVWPTKEDDATYETVLGQEEYNLSSLDDLRRAHDIDGVEIRPAASGVTAYSDWVPVSYRAYDDRGTVYVRFPDAYPSGYPIRIRYRTRPTVPTASVATDLDLRFLVADCMLRLLRRRPGDVEPGEWRELLAIWRQERQEALLGAHTPFGPRQATVHRRHLEAL